jgi:4-hydroxybenzoate polyprenyltransferase
MIKMLFQEGFSIPKLKSIVAREESVDPATLPYNQVVLDLIHSKKRDGYTIILATAASSQVAQGVCNHLGVFDDVLSSTEDLNCKGASKLRLIQEYSQDRHFEYVGDSQADIQIFNASSGAYIVGSLPYPHSHVRIPGTRNSLGFIKAMRPHQWAKNTLIFLPLITSHLVTYQTIGTACLGFLLFSLTASAIYIINDMVDIEDDRHNDHKKNRPFANGNIKISQGIGLSLILLLVSVGLSYSLLPGSVGLICVYIGLTILYSFFLKQQPIIDVFCLCSLYTLRAYYGQVINHIEHSSWLLAFCLFFFLSLALMKRTSELRSIRDRGLEMAGRRGYQLQDLDLIKIAGICSGLISVVVFTLYINTSKVLEIYAFPDYLWGSSYVLLYWVLRVWLLASRGHMNQDPILFALKDPSSYGIGALIILFGMLAKGLI